MFRFQIGCIEGPWINFVPPIQGGKFRPYTGSDNENEEDNGSKSDEATSNISREISRSPSPTFEAPSGIRRRKSTASSTASTNTTISSGDEKQQQQQNDDKNQKSQTFLLDARTQQEIDVARANYPSLDLENQEFIRMKYRELDQRIEAEGLYQCHYFSYFIEACRCSFFASLAYLFLRLEWYITSSFFLGCFWHQLVFCAHDAGHIAITHRYHVDSVIGMTIADYLGGLSLGWWKRNHNVHHIVTNAPEHDPDIEHMPIFAISHRLLGSLRSTYYDRVMEFDKVAKVMLKFQNYLYYPILLFGRFNLYRLSFEYLLGNQAPKKGPAWWHRWYELAGQVFFWYWFGYVLLYRSVPDWSSRIMYLLVSHMVTSPLHVQITLSHFAMSTADLGVAESFPQKTLRTTMDVDCPRWLDFFHGGLQFQAIHHLFPRLPRHNLRATQRLVKEFSRETGIPYVLFTFVDGNKVVISRLGDVANQVRLLEQCRKAYAQQEIVSPSGH